MKEKIEFNQRQGDGLSLKFLHWWFALSAPSQPLSGTSLVLREKARRGRLASTILLIVLLIVSAFLVLAIFSPNKLALLSMSITFAFVCLAVFLNRMGWTTVAGLMMIAVLDLGIANIFLSNAHGLSITALPIYDMFILSELMAVAFLPPASVLLVALVNSLFIFMDVSFQRPAPDLAPLLATARYEIMLGPISLQIVIAVVLFLWAQSALRAIARADRAEEIAVLRERESEQKRQLDEGIQQILQTHVQIANGDFSTRAPMSKENVLWQIAYSLNNLAARLQRLSSVEHEQQRIKTLVEQLTQRIQLAKQMQQPLSIPRTGTYLDPLLIEISNNLSNSSDHKR
jgi:hypothetical protein